MIVLITFIGSYSMGKKRQQCDKKNCRECSSQGYSRHLEMEIGGKAFLSAEPGI